MTPRERVLKLFRREPIDRMPVFSGQGMVVLPAIKALNLRFPEIHLTGENMAASALRTAEMFGFEGVVIPYDMCTIPEAIGLGISIYQDSEEILYPTLPYKWKTVEEIIIPDDLVKIVVNTIKDSSKTGKIGDGKIFILPVEEIIRIRTGERGEDAL